ncbi:ribonuclease H-like domain-containing protein [Tanacetum coccineum]
MLEVLMNVIGCDLEKAIQQHPGNKEIENIKLLWKENLLKRASEMNKKDKERHREQIFKVDRGMKVEGEQNNQEMEVDLEKDDAHKTIDADKQGASRLKDIDVQNKSERTDWAKHSNISALTPKMLSSFDEQFDPVKVVSTVEDHSLVLPANDIPSFDLGLTPTPPDVYINADKQDVSNQGMLPPKKAKVQESTTNASATTITNTAKIEVVSNSVKDPSSDLLLNDASSCDLGITPTPPNVKLDTYTEPMLENERVKKNAKELGPMNTITAFDVVPLSFAMPNATLSEKTLNEKNNVKALLYFIDDMEFVTKNAKVDNIYNIDMIWRELQEAEKTFHRVLVIFRTSKLEVDEEGSLHIWDMRRTGNVNSRMRDGNRPQDYDLRKKYLSKILKSDLNCKRTVLLNELDQFRKLPYEKRVKFLKDRIESSKVTNSLYSKEPIKAWDQQVVSEPCALRYFDLGKMELENSQNNSLAKLPILKLGEYEMWEIRIKQYFQIQDYALWEVIENGNSWVPIPVTAPESGPSTALKMTVPSTTEEKMCKKNDVKARSLLLMALPNEHQLTFNQYADAQSITSSTNSINTGNTGVSTGNSKVNTASAETSTASFSDATAYAFLSSQPQGSQLVHEDLEQIHDDDLEEMDLKWNMALLSMRARKFYQRTGRKIVIDGSSTAGYDKSKVECFNCHKMGHFFIQRIAEYQEVKKTETEVKQALKNKDEVQANMALMAFSDSEVSCSKSCLLNYETLKKQYDDLLVKLDDTAFKASTYKRGLSILEAQVVKYKESYSSSKPTTVCNRESHNSKENIDDSLTQQPKSITETSSAVSTLKEDPKRAIENTDATNNLRDGVSMKSVKVELPKSRKENDYCYKGSGVNTTNQVVEQLGMLRCIGLRDLGGTKEVGMSNSQLNEKGFVDSGCSRHMSGNIAHLSDFKEFDGGYVTFGGGANGGRITGKAKLLGYTTLEQGRYRKTCMLGFLENKPMFERKGPKWSDDLDSIITQSMKYVPVVAGSSSIVSAGTQEVSESSTPYQQDQDCIIMPIWKDASYFEDTSLKSVADAQIQDQDVNTGSGAISTASPEVNTATSEGLMGPIPTTEDTQAEDQSIDLGNLSPSYAVSSTPHTRIHKDHPIDHVIGDVQSFVQTRRMTTSYSELGFISAIYEGKTHQDLHTCLFACFLSQEEPKRVSKALSDPAWVEAMQEELLQFKLQNVWVLVDLPKGHRAIVTKSPLSLVAYLIVTNAGATLDRKTPLGGEESCWLFLSVRVTIHTTNGHQFTMSDNHQELTSPEQTAPAMASPEQTATGMSNMIECLPITSNIGHDLLILAEFVEPMLENERVKKNAKELKRKDFDKENIPKEANDKESKKMKREVKLSGNVKSPFLESLYPGITVHVGVINMWSQVCNFEERLRSPDSMRRLFCHSSMISEKMLNEKDSVKALTYFIDDMEFVMKSAKVDNISNIDMVLFPVILAKSHYYLVVFNLKTPKIKILDNSKNRVDSLWIQDMERPSRSWYEFEQDV